MDEKNISASLLETCVLNILYIIGEIIPIGIKEVKVCRISWPIIYGYYLEATAYMYLLSKQFGPRKPTKKTCQLM